MNTAKSVSFGVRGGCIAILVCLFAFVALPAAGQGTQAGILGQVVDASGGVLPGVSVTVSSPSLQTGTRTEVTNELGEFTIRPLPPGVYTVNFELAGFRPVRREDIRLTLGFTARLDISMVVGGVEETITVSGQAPVVDVASTSGSTLLTNETLELTVTTRNSIASLLGLAPGVRTFVEVGGNQIAENPDAQTFGQLGQEWYTIDGITTVQINNAFWDNNTLEEVRVQTVGTDAEFPTRGVQVTGIIKSGGNQFHGGGTFSYNNDTFQSSNIGPELEAQGFTAGQGLDEQKDGFGEFGGRIVRDKLWFYGAARRRTLAYNLLNAFNPDGSQGQNLVDFSYATIKGSYQVNPSHRIVGLYVHSSNFEVKGQDELFQYENREAHHKADPLGKVEWEGLFGNRMVAQAQWGRIKHSGPQFFQTDPYQVPARDLDSEIRTGEHVVSGEDNARGPGDHLKTSMSYFKPNWGGNHEFKTGLDVLLWKAGGKISVKPLPYGLSFAGGFFDRALADARRPQVQNGEPAEVYFFNAVDTHTRFNNIAWYGKDSWTIGRLLTVNLGVRVEHAAAWVPEQRFESAQSAPFPMDLIFPAFTQERVDAPTFFNVQPRLHAAYDITGDGRTVVKGGFGRYYSFQEGTAGAYNGIRRLMRHYKWRDLNGNRNFDLGEANLDPNGPDFIEGTGAEFGGVGAASVVNPDEKQTRFDEFSVSLERELMANFSLRATGIHSRWTNLIRTENIKRPFEVWTERTDFLDPGEDGIPGTGDFGEGNVLSYWEYPAELAGARNELFMRVNDPSIDQTFTSFELAAVKRLSNSYQFTASYSATKRDKPAGSSNAEATGAAYTPNGNFNTADRSWDWDGKVTGTYIFPYDINLGTTVHYTSGNQFSRLVRVQTRRLGSIQVPAENFGERYRSPSITIVNFRVEKRFPLPKGQRVGIQLNAYNFLNSSTAVRGGDGRPSVTALSGRNFQRPRDILPPRIFELSASYNF